MDTISAARRTAPGRDEIPVICWQACSAALAPILLGLYNACLQWHYYPRQWKRAHILPLPKGTKNRSSPSSWRPISLLCNAGKFMEKIMQRRLSRLLEQIWALSEVQHVFRRNRSTESALLLLPKTRCKPSTGAGKSLLLSWTSPKLSIQSRTRSFFARCTNCKSLCTSQTSSVPFSRAAALH